MLATGDAVDTPSDLIGRDEERRTVEASLRRASASARLVYVDGPAGIGKTTLAEAVADGWRAAGGEVRWARCWDGPGTPPLWPWNRLLDHDLAADPERGRTTDRPAESVMFERFERAVEQLVAASTARDLLLVVDDAHWADDASLELLRFVSRHPDCRDVALLVTARTPEATITAPADHLADVASRSTHVGLVGLTVDDVAHLLATAGLPEDGASELHERTGGNPLFVTEMVRAASAGDPESVPRSLSVIVSRHLAALDGADRDLIGLAAVQGQVFDVRVLAAAAGVPVDEVKQALDDIARFDLVEGTGASWRFPHALIGDAVVAELTPDQLRHHHLATADAIVKVDDGNDRSTTVVNHLVRSEHLCPPDRLAESAIEAADSAAARAAWVDEARYLDIAVEARRALRPDRPGPFVDLLLRRCRALKAARDFVAARAVAVEAARLVESIDDVDRLVELALTYPPDSEGVEIDEIHDPQQARLRELALECVPSESDLARARLQAGLALSLYWETPIGDRAEAHESTTARRSELTSAALATAREAGDDATLIAALDARIHATWGPETVDERPRLADELFEAARRHGDVRRVLAARVWRVVERLESARLGSADREIAGYEADALRINDAIGAWTVTRWRANRAFMIGDLDRCEALSADALGQALAVLPENVSMSFYVTMLGPLHYLRCSLDDDIETIEHIAAESPGVPAWRVGLSVALAECGRVEEAAEILRMLAAQDFAMLPRDLNFFGAMMMLALAAHHVGDPEIAAAIAEHLRPRTGRYAIHGTGYTSYGPTDLGLAQCLDAAGHRDEADAHYLAAIELGEQVGTPYVHIAQWHRGAMLAASSPSTARAELQRAAAGLRSFDLGAMADRVDRALDDMASRRTWRLLDDGDGWRLERPDGVRVELGSLKGLRALSVLLERPHQAVHALELSAAMEGGAVVGEGSIERLDRAAVRRYEQRLVGLRDELDLADRRGDVAASARLQDEYDAIGAELARGAGFGGRLASDPSAADRARVNITKHLKRAVDRVRGADGLVGAHLDAFVSTGMHCVYEPADGVVLHIGRAGRTS